MNTGCVIKTQDLIWRTLSDKLSTYNELMKIHEAVGVHNDTKRTFLSVVFMMQATTLITQYLVEIWRTTCDYNAHNSPLVPSSGSSVRSFLEPSTHRPPVGNFCKFCFFRSFELIMISGLKQFLCNLNYVKQ